jgi:hypothetical protein
MYLNFISGLVRSILFTYSMFFGEKAKLELSSKVVIIAL